MTSCSKCSVVADATLSFDYADAHVWLDDLSVRTGAKGYPLCGMHADGFTPPVGWILSDHRRTAAPTLALDVA